MASVGVLLSAFHGGQYLREQLMSIRLQTGVEPHLLYHLDASQPGADEEELDRFPGSQRVPLDPGLGVPSAYMALLSMAKAEYQFWAFADQDDRWHRDKLARATQALRTYAEVPTLWVCRVRLVDADGEAAEEDSTFPKSVPTPSLGNALVQNIAPGCAMVWNRPLHEALLSAPMPDGVIMHDAWVYLVASAIGRVLVDSAPLVDYRIHGSNAVGIANSLGDRVARRLGQLSDRSRPTLASQAQALLDHFGGRLPDAKKKLVEDVANVKRARLAQYWVRQELWRQGARDNVLLLPALLTMHHLDGESRGTSEFH